MDSVHPRDLERAWLRCVLLLVLLVVLFALLRHAPLAGFKVVSDDPVTEPTPVTTVPAAIRAAPVEVTVTGSRLLFPLPGYEHALRDNFHEKRGMRTHKALDIMAPRGTPVRAVEDGTIAKLYRGPMAGIAVYQFDRDKTRVYFYAHLDRYAGGLEAGQPVRRGDVIGFVGSTGNAPERAPHLHFEMRALGEDKRWWRGEAINPYRQLRASAD
jgi:murein DD-endopeptidase MepM/ murein hydrolase activator NlpD